MTRALAASLLSLCFLAAACNKAAEPGTDVDVAGTGGKSGGQGGLKSDPPASTGGKSGAGTGGVTGTGGQVVTGTGGDSATGGSTGGGADASASDAPPATGGSTGTDSAAPTDATSTPGSDGGFNPEGDSLPGKPYIHLCKKDWTQAQCCEFLCQCLDNICTDSPKAKPGLATCMPTCMKLSNMLMRCHVYHCFESKNPNAVQDHDSHCGHAANQVNGGGCPTAVYQ